MTTEIQESLSALLDGELGEQEVDRLLTQIRDDQELRRLWGRYHMVGDLLRGEKMLIDASALADRVQAQLRDEPAIIAAPRPGAAAGEARQAVVAPIPLARPDNVRQHPHSWRRLAAGAALAASVAALAVFVAPLFESRQADLAPTVAKIAEPVRPAITEVDADGNRWRMLPTSTQARLNGYLVQHSDYASVNGVGGMLPYTSYVSYPWKP